MKKTIGFLFVALAALCAVGCDRDDSTGSGGSGPVEARITAGVGTRADGSLWTADRIGVMVTDSPSSDMASRYVNVEYATDSETATADFEAVNSAEKICFLDPGETVTFAAYAPYSETDDIATLPGTDGVISASTASQSTITDQTALDFLYSSGATGTRSEPDVTMTFSHVMSKIVIRLSGENSGMSDVVTGGTYYLGGLIHNGEFDVNPDNTETCGTAYASGTTVDDEWELNSNGLKATNGSDCDISYSAIVFPQSPLYLDLIADIGGLTYAGLDLLSVVDGGELQAGKSYTFNVTITTTELYVSGCTVSGWTSEAVSKDVIANIDADLLILHYSITSSTEVTLPLYSTVNCTVDWGDGTVDTVTSNWPTHTYSSAGEYDVAVKGTVTRLNSNDIGSSAELLTAVKQWGRTGLTSMYCAFYKCTALASIPGDTYGAFADVTTFYEAFMYCSALASIPENLFAYAVKTTSFQEIFWNCTSLTEIPENLFANNTAVTTFSGTFCQCSSLTSIPKSLFANNSKVTNFTAIFCNCHVLEIPENLFANNTKATVFERAFFNCTSLTGESAFDVVEIEGIDTKVHLYERYLYPDTYTEPTSYRYCYLNCSKLDDYDYIPSAWGGGGD